VAGTVGPDTGPPDPQMSRSLQPSLSASPPLAHAFIALGDPGDVADRTPALSTILAAVAAALVLAMSAPLAWAAAPVPKPSDQPSATTASKASVPAPDDDGADGGV
jgi:hypothetical protein